MTIQGEMRPCPFCGCEDLRLEGGQMVCTSCRAKGPIKGVPTEDEEMKARIWWNDRDLKATEEVYEGGKSNRCPFCGCTSIRIYECLKERGWAVFCEACRACGPLVAYPRDTGPYVTNLKRHEEELRKMYANRSYMTARNILSGRVVI